MEKIIVRWSYWLGVACVVVALLMRTANAAGLMTVVDTRGMYIGYMSFFKGAILFLLTAVATSSYLSATTPKS